MQKGASDEKCVDGAKNGREKGKVGGVMFGMVGKRHFVSVLWCSL